MRIRSPGYPSINLSQAIDYTDKIFRISRQNSIDREAAAKDIGYSGLTGQSSKILADLAHFGLVEKAGKGGLRVTDLAVRILHPRSSAERLDALNTAAYSPDLYGEIKQQWPDGFVSENALRGHLMRSGFSSAAVAPALSSFFETYRYLQQEGATESYRQTGAQDEESADGGRQPSNQPSGEGRALTLVTQEKSLQASPSGELRTDGIKLMNNERVVFVEESGPSQYLKVVASGEFDETMLEALEDYIKRQKKRLALTPRKDTN